MSIYIDKICKLFNFQWLNCLSSLTIKCVIYYISQENGDNDSSDSSDSSDSNDSSDSSDSNDNKNANIEDVSQIKGLQESEFSFFVVRNEDNLLSSKLVYRSYVPADLWLKAWCDLKAAK